MEFSIGETVDKHKDEIDDLIKKLHLWLRYLPEVIESYLSSKPMHIYDKMLSYRVLVITNFLFLREKKLSDD